MHNCLNDLEMSQLFFVKPEVILQDSSDDENNEPVTKNGSYVSYAFEEKDARDTNRKGIVLSTLNVLERTTISSLQGIKEILESEIKDIIDNKKDTYSFTDTKSDFCDYGKIFK